ncbi:T9SS type A sorting domain-containing protein [Aquimarina sp. AU474]|uniref:T9SS type A sorting domain-containing protein n=1 Tax=Aquimarina sp. AU474 TaxID=2108529 RepID=UPI000D690329|nr:T9SS type A sorting domain-containing protein [Aquimarina sp. AU474]
MRTFSIYQNPIEGKVYVDLIDQASSVSLKVLNKKGKIVRKKNKLAIRNTISFASLPEGIYTVRVENESKVMTKKFLKL